MLVLVLGADFPVMFVGWEGVGLCSYLLIGFWFTKKSAADAGKKAFVVNRIGDFGFILGMLLLFVDVRHARLPAAWPRPCQRCRPRRRWALITIATLLLFLGATGKSAQIPLYVWLPDAMEGPTPVSALIHAATMVTAGVYMIGRNAVLFQHAPMTLAVVAVDRRRDGADGRHDRRWCRTTSSACSRTRRSRSSATCSWRWASARTRAGIFHLYTHAFFKALLFLGSGAVIHALHGEQDIRNMGGLKKCAADHLLDVPRSARSRSPACRRSPGSSARTRSSARRSAAVARMLWCIGVLTSLPDRDLHVPPGVPDLPRRTAARRAGSARMLMRRPPVTAMALATATATARTAVMHPHDALAVDGARVDRPRGRIRRRRLRRRSARPERRATNRGVPRAQRSKQVPGAVASTADVRR